MSYANNQVRTTISIQLCKREIPTESAEAVVWRCSVKKVFLEHFFLQKPLVAGFAEDVSVFFFFLTLDYIQFENLMMTPKTLSISMKNIYHSTI